LEKVVVVELLEEVVVVVELLLEEEVVVVELLEVVELLGLPGALHQ
jgi:hypothetical protein